MKKSFNILMSVVIFAIGIALSAFTYGQTNDCFKSIKTIMLLDKSRVAEVHKSGNHIRLIIEKFVVNNGITDKPETILLEQDAKKTRMSSEDLIVISDLNYRISIFPKMKKIMVLPSSNIDSSGYFDFVMGFIDSYSNYLKCENLVLDDNGSLQKVKLIDERSSSGIQSVNFERLNICEYRIKGSAILSKMNFDEVVMNTKNYQVRSGEIFVGSALDQILEGDFQLIPKYRDYEFFGNN